MYETLRVTLLKSLILWLYPRSLKQTPQDWFLLYAYFQFSFYEGWVQNQWGYKLLFCLLGLLRCLRKLCCYYSVASFCSSFYSTQGKTSGVNFCSFVTNLVKHAPNIQQNVFGNFHMTLIHGALHRIFTRPPFFQKSSKR